METVKNNERRVCQRVIAPDGVFVLMDKKALPVLDISLGGLAFCAEQNGSSFSSDLEVLVMGDTIQYVENIPHNVVADVAVPVDTSFGTTPCNHRVSTQFSDLSVEQQAKLRYLFFRD